MKRTLILVILVVCSIPARARLGKDFNLFKHETNNKIQNQQNDLTGIKADIQTIVNVSNNMNARIEGVEAKVSAQGNAVVGLKNDIKQTNTDIKARDITNTNVNDTDLMKEIFKGLFALVTAICAGLFTSLKAKEKHIQALIKSNSKKETELDNWQNKTIDRLINGKTKGQQEADRLLEEAKKDVKQGGGKQ